MDKNNGCARYRFTFADKVLGNLALYAGVAIGAWAMYLAEPWLALGYVAFVVVGLLLVVRYTVCPRCPHLLENGDCLFVPPGFAAGFISRSRSGPMGLGEKLILYGVFGGMALIPVYWLLGRPWLLGAYGLAQVFVALAFRCNLCRKCENEACPLNKPRAQA